MKLSQFKFNLPKEQVALYPHSSKRVLTRSDGSTQTWKPKDKDALTLVEHSKDWHAQFGVKILGGCCRTRPNDIKALYAEFRT